jgi:hypothetical protein
MAGDILDATFTWQRRMISPRYVPMKSSAGTGTALFTIEQAVLTS